MDQKLAEIKSIVENLSRRSLATWLIRWSIGLSIIVVLTTISKELVWLWYIVIPVALASLVFTLTTKYILTRKINVVDKAQKSLQKQLVPENEKLESYIVGKWILDTTHEGNHIRGITQYCSDHKLLSKVSINVLDSIVTCEAEGSWFVKGRILTWTIEKSTNTELLAIGMSQCEEILSISRESKTYKDPDGTIWEEQRT